MEHFIFTCNGGTRPGGPSQFVGTFIGSQDDAITWLEGYLSSGSENRYNFDGTIDYAFRRIVCYRVGPEGDLEQACVWKWCGGVWNRTLRN